MPDHYDKPSSLPSFTPVGSYEGLVPFSGVFDAILQNSAQKAFMETEGMFTAAEAAFETAQRDLRDIQMTVPQEQQAEKLAEYLRNNGYSSDIVTQTLGIPKAEVNAALTAGGYDTRGNPLPDLSGFTPAEQLGSAVFGDSPMALIPATFTGFQTDESGEGGSEEQVVDLSAKTTDEENTTASTIPAAGASLGGGNIDEMSGAENTGLSDIQGL